MKDEQRELLRSIIQVNMGSDLCTWHLSDGHEAGVLNRLKGNGYIKEIPREEGQEVNVIRLNVTAEGLKYLAGK